MIWKCRQKAPVALKLLGLLFFVGVSLGQMARGQALKIDLDDETGLSENQITLRLIPPAPKGLLPADIYKWNRDHAFKIADLRRERKKRELQINYDWTTFKTPNQKSLDEICHSPYTPTHVTQDGNRVLILGGAFVYMEPSNGQSVFGHVGERFIYCFNQNLIDVLYEYLPATDEALKDLQADFGPLPPDYVESLKGVLILKATFNPTDLHYGAIQYIQNRTIFEAWFKAEPQQLLLMLQANAERFQKQKLKLSQREEFEKYKLIGNNCTAPVEEDLQVLNPSVVKGFLSKATPSLLFDSVKKLKIEKIVAYPSQRLFRVLRMKEVGQSTFKEYFAPASQASKGSPRGWVFIYPDFQSRFKQFILMPPSGVLNTAAATLETIYGILTTPLVWLGKLFGLDSGFIQSAGPVRIQSGFNDILASLGEVIWMRVRYPTSVNWTDDEKEFLKGLEQTSVIVDFLTNQKNSVPVFIQGT